MHNSHIGCYAVMTQSYTLLSEEAQEFNHAELHLMKELRENLELARRNQSKASLRVDKT
jgi:hypothetical protein